MEAEAALEEMDDAEMEEREVEETEDLLEYYLQRAAGTQSEAERLLAGARDLEESIGVSLSARRFEVRTRKLYALYLPFLFERIWNMRLSMYCEALPMHSSPIAESASDAAVPGESTRVDAQHRQLCSSPGSYGGWNLWHESQVHA